MKTVLKQAVMIAALAALFGLVVNTSLLIRFAKGEFQFLSFSDPQGFIISVGLDKVLNLEDEEGPVTFIDSRSPEDYARGHIPGARSIPVNDPQKKVILQRLNLAPNYHPIIVYCSGGECLDSTHLAEWMTGQGFTTIWVFTGGWDQWKAGGFPVETGYDKK